MMSNRQPQLWPFGVVAAMLTALGTWLLMAIVFSVTGTYVGWPDDASKGTAALIVIFLGLLPVILLLLDFAAVKRAVVDIKGLKIDFSRVDLSQPGVSRETPGIPDNFGVSGPIVSDTSPMNIIETLRTSIKHELVVIDLKNGDAWWVTRLLALSAGAVRSGGPEAFVFVGKNANRDCQYFGWAKAADVLDSILRSKQEYQRRYDKALRIANQVILFSGLQPPPPFELPPDVQRYMNQWQLSDLGDAVTEQILMDQLASIVDTGASLESPPDRLTLSRLRDLFAHCLDTKNIDLNWPKRRQIHSLLDPMGQYVALVKSGHYESLVKKQDGERLLLRELFAQLRFGEGIDSDLPTGPSWPS